MQTILFTVQQPDGLAFAPVFVRHVCVSCGHADVALAGIYTSVFVQGKFRRGSCCSATDQCAQTAASN